MDVPVLDLTAGAAWATRPETNLERAGLRADHLAYIIYTSGSTGMPKGVMLEHGNAVNFLAWAAANFDAQALERTLFATSLNFDLHVFECFAPLTVGATLQLVKNALELPAAEAGVSLVNTVPSAMKALVETDGVPATVRTVNLAGEPLKRVLVEQIFAKTGVERVCNLYGPSETTTYSTWVEMDRAGGFIPHIGRPVANTQVYILDAHGEPVPVGVTGELYIGGAGVARGYLNRPELTAERFLDDPFSGGRMYRTGDLGRWLSDGNIEYLGRNDFQVKIRGFRIELGEVESRIAGHAEVRDAAVLAREDETGDKRLVAYYVGAAEADVLRASLAEGLPEYMIPSVFVRMDALPLTPNGKLDRKALPAPEFEAAASRGFETPVGVVETALAGIWSAVLGVERIGRGDNFFEMGGHSLRAVQVISRVRQVLNIEATLGDLFARPVLADFARGLETAVHAELPAIVPAERGAEVALSFAQQRLWFLEQLGSAGRAYHMPTRLRLRGELDRDALVRALDRIVERHEALRTTFHSVDGQPVQRIAPASGFALVQHDLCGRADAEAELRQIVVEESGAAFDLEHGPLVRGRLVRMAADDHVLLVTMHHIVSDGWSMGVLTNELSTLYTAFQSGAADPLAPLPVQYADYAAWQRKWVDGDVLQQQVDYWKTTLSGAPELLELPTDHVRPLVQSHAGAALGLELDGELTAGLKALSQRHGTTLFMTLMAAWATVLSRLSGQDDVVIGTPTANRGRKEIEGLIGFFVNTLAVRMDLGGAPTVAELLGRVKERALGAQDHQDIPFEQVVELVQPARSMAHSPLFQVMFTWQNNPKGSLELPGLKLGSVGAAAHTTAKFDLSLDMQEAGGRIIGGVTYATALFEQATIERYLGYLRMVLEAMVADEQQTVDRLTLLPAAERTQVLESFNATALEYPTDACMHELFEAQVERTPNATAVMHAAGSLTYAELNARANRLAHHLREGGVGPDTRVAICMERTPEMVVGLLAVLKAGGAYVPLDPAYPADRIAYMLQDSAPRAVLTQPSLSSLFDGMDVPVLDLTADAAWATRPETNVERSDLRADHLAYIIYTSGSTGMPKGVMLEHGNAVNFLAWAAANFDAQALERTLFATSLNFDLHVFECFAPLTVGATLQLVKNALELPATEAGVSLVNTVPSAMKALVETDGVPATVRTVNLAGEPLKRVLVEQIFAKTGVERVCNLYGPSETTTYSTWVEMDRAGGFIPHIGRPVANTQVYILDAHGEPVPVGVTGELYIGGAGVARGYLNRPELTAERFLDDPFSGGRMYRTGDLGRWLADGNIEYLGRNDFQVKIRGFRIELGEVESRIAGHAEVRDAAVLAREDETGDKRLVAYYVGAAESEVLRASLAEQLPEYMIPSVFMRMDALPLTPNGKLDRKALPAPELDTSANEYEAPAGEVEEALAGIWSAVLGVERIGRHDNFFDLGGHSLRVVQLVARVRQVLGAEVALADVFSHPTLEGFAARVQADPSQPVADGAIAVRRGGTQTPLFVVYEGAGTVAYAQALRPFIDADVPVYALPDVPASEPRLRTVEGMAARLVRMMREVQPAGPYRLAGWSFGGLLAYEAAAQLIGQDEEVEFVGMIDTHYYGAGLPAGVETAGEDDEKQDAAWADRARESGLLPRDADFASITRMRERIRSSRREMLEYHARPIPMPVHLFTARQSTAGPTRGWEAVLPVAQIRVTEVPGSHMTMMSGANAEVVGRELSRAVADAARERPGREKAYSPLVTLQFGKKGAAPLYCVPGAGASVVSFAELSGCVDPSRPVHGFQPRGLDGEMVPHSTVQAAAAAYLREIDATQPEGPVHLLGHSFGGWVVLEIAKRLREAGRVVGSLTIVDTQVPHDAGVQVEECDGSEAFLHLTRIFEQTVERPLRIGADDIQGLDEAGRLKLLHERLVEVGLMPRRSAPEVLRGPFRSFATAVRTTYCPGDPYPDPVRLVLVGDPDQGFAENRRYFAETVRGWRRWAPSLVFTEGTGNHMTALKHPNIAAIASGL